jgi:hypothetical protein
MINAAMSLDSQRIGGERVMLTIHDPHTPSTHRHGTATTYLEAVVLPQHIWAAWFSIKITY